MVMKDESITYHLQLKNRSPFFFSQIKCSIHSDDIIDYGEGMIVGRPLRPFGSIVYETAIRLPYRGVYPLGVDKLVFTDLLGLFSFSIIPPEKIAVTAYPKIDDSFALSICNEPQNSSLNTDLFNEDYSSIADIRKYASTDSLRKIHWKLSAKRGELVSKNYNTFDPDRIILFLDGRALPLEGGDRAFFEDRIVSYVASAVDHCTGGRLLSDLMYGQTPEHISLHNLEDISEVYNILASVQFQGEDSCLYAIKDVSGAYNLVVFLADIDTALYDELRTLISFDHNLILYYFFSEALPLTEEKEYLLARLKAYGAGLNRVEVL